MATEKTNKLLKAICDYADENKLTIDEVQTACALMIDVCKKWVADIMEYQLLYGNVETFEALGIIGSDEHEYN